MPCLLWNLEVKLPHIGFQKWGPHYLFGLAEHPGCHKWRRGQWWANFYIFLSLQPGLQIFCELAGPDQPRQRSLGGLLTELAAAWPVSWLGDGLSRDMHQSMPALSTCKVGWLNCGLFLVVWEKPYYDRLRWFSVWYGICSLELQPLKRFSNRDAVSWQGLL